MQPHPRATETLLSEGVFLGSEHSADSFYVLHNYLCCLLSSEKAPGRLSPALVSCDIWGKGGEQNSSFFTLILRFLPFSPLPFTQWFPRRHGGGPLAFVGMRFPLIGGILFLSVPHHWSKNISPGLCCQQCDWFLVFLFAFISISDTPALLLPWGKASPSPTSM